MTFDYFFVRKVMLVKYSVEVGGLFVTDSVEEAADRIAREAGGAP